MDSATRIPCTLLSGFLGAGKTTLLGQILTQAQGQGRRLALVVNDVGAINIDARLVEGTRRLGGAELVELSGGCVCCSSSGDLAETLCRLGAEGRHAHVIVEATGVAEPRALASLFLRPNVFGRSVSDFLILANLVTVVDAADFLRRWESRDSVESPAAGRRPLLELLVEQAECADLLILNKCDLLTEKAQETLETLLQGLNPRAELLATEQGQAPIEWLLDRVRFEGAATLSAARWIQELNALAPGAEAAKIEATRGPKVSRIEPEHTRRYGLRSFAFRSRRPFRQAALSALLEEGFPGIVRAKGFCWIAERPDEMSFLSLAGGVASQTWLNYWWASMIESGKARLEDRPPLIKALWEEPAGDRRQELVFIGIEYDEVLLRKKLEHCLT